MKHLLLTGLALFALYTFWAKPVPQSAVTGPVARSLSSAPKADRAYVAAIYHSLADILQRDNGQRITTTSIWRAIHSDSLRLAVGGTSLKDKYSGLDKAVEETLAKYYGLEDVPLTPELIEKIIAACKDVEAQCLTN